jgi:hypothetical protein
MTTKKHPTIQQTDRRLNRLAKEATKTAYRNTLQSGRSVLIASNGEIRKVSPNGKFSVVKKTEPNVPVKKGTEIRVK